MSNADTVNAWFSEKIATGEIARDTAALNQASAAKSQLIARLDAGADPAATIANWYPQQFVCGYLARNAAAAEQAEGAMADLIGRLSTEQPDPEPAAEAATEKE
jgi:hypothetical protein